ncbi:hypothetical protein RRG08_005117 [Elysia crispata]|uniref:Uncharacterized protein n=1 Tax=Elysia crispata TaxID=231223 RepID=A0AAE0YCK3_9GAST|nr:hypothetical protein RRG08_005117 [Elysia crispata]
MTWKLKSGGGGTAFGVGVVAETQSTSDVDDTDFVYWPLRFAQPSLTNQVDEFCYLALPWRYTAVNPTSVHGNESKISQRKIRESSHMCVHENRKATSPLGLLRC